MLGVVVQIDGFDPVLAQAVTLRAASHDDSAVCHAGGGEPWWPALIKLPTLRYDLFDGAFGGEITAPSSSLTLAAEPWPNLGRYALADARLRLWTGDVGAPWESWTLRFDGRVSEQPELADGTASISFAVDDRWLDRALLSTYAGTSGAEGTEALKGQPKPLALGAPRYVAGTLIDSIDTVFQLSAYGPVRGFEAALERLARFGTSAGDFASYAALVAANVPAGRWATAKAVGMARLGAPPSGQVSFLIGGDDGGPNGWARLPGAIIRRLALLSGGAGRINDASLDALDVARPYNQSIYVDQQTTARQLIQQIAASVNAVAGMSWTGQLFVVPVGIGAPAVTLAADGSALPPVTSVKQIGIASPFQKLAIGAARAWTVHALSDIAFTATLLDLGTYAESSTYREGNIVSLEDGSRWLFINSVATAGHAPPVGGDGDEYWTNLSGPIASTPAWDDVTNPNGTKPADNADVTSDNTSKDTAAVGGKPAAEVLATLEKIVPIEARFEPIETRFGPIETSVSALERAKVGTDAALASLAIAGADQDAVLRQIERDAGRLDETLLRLLSESTRTRAVLRDAGIIVDPITGIVRIYAVDQLADRTSRAEITIDGVNAKVTTKASVDYVNEQIALAVLDPAQAAQFEPIIARLTSVEQVADATLAALSLKAEAIELTRVSGTVTTVRQDLDALAGTVSTKAEKTVVDALGIAVGSVEQTLSTLGNVSGISVTIRQARAVADDAATAALRGLLAGEDVDRRRIVAQSEIRQELYTKIVDGLSAEAVARTVLSVQIGDLDSRSVQETTARITGETVLGQRIDALSVTSGQQAAAIATLSAASIEAGVGIAGVSTTIRQQTRDEDQSAEALLTSMIAGEQATKRRADQLVQIQTEFTTTLVANEAASAIARQALLARMGLAEAAIVTTSKVLADTTQALTSRIQAAEAVFGDATTGLAATRARLIQEETLRASGDRVNASAISLLDAVVNDPASGLPATRAVIAHDRDTNAARDAANARDVQQLSAQVNDATTGLPATAARVASEAEASTTRDTALGRRVDVVQADLGTTNASVATQAEASLTRDTALGRRVDVVQADLGTTTASVTTQAEASLTRDTALGRRVDVVQADLGTTNATVATNRQAQVDGDQAISRLVEQIRAVIDGVGSVGLQQAFEAVVTRLGKIEGRYAVSIDVNGNLSGFQLIGGATGPASFNLINTDLKMGTGRIIYDNGKFMEVQGVSFGVARDLIEWFGPTMDVAKCSRANAISYKSTDGDAYFGGSLSAGILRNASASSGLSVSEVAQIGPFGSNGRPVRYVASWAYRTASRATYPATNEGLRQYNAAAAAANAPSDGTGGNFGTKTTEQANSTIVLTRALAGGDFVQIDQRGFTTQTTTFSGQAPTTGDAPGFADITSTIGGGFTVNDPVQSASDRTVRLTLARGFTAFGDTVSQRLSVIATEE